MKDGQNVTSLVRQFGLTKEELQILEPLDKKRDELKKQIDSFVGGKVVPRLPIESNRKYSVRFNVKEGWIKIKQMDTRAELRASVESFKDTMGWGK